GRELLRLAGEFDEGGLDDFLGQLGGTDLAERGGMDEVEMAPDDFGEGVLGILPCVARKQFQVGIAHVQKDNAAASKNPPRNFIGNAKKFAVRPDPVEPDKKGEKGRGGARIDPYSPRLEKRRGRVRLFWHNDLFFTRAGRYLLLAQDAPGQENFVQPGP